MKGEEIFKKSGMEVWKGKIYMNIEWRYESKQKAEKDTHDSDLKGKKRKYKEIGEYARKRTH